MAWYTLAIEGLLGDAGLYLEIFICMSHEYVIVTLSTIPPRFEKIQPALQSLLNQSLNADEVNLYIPKVYKRFGTYDIEKLIVPDGVTIKVIEEDMGPATKVLPCVQENRGQEVFIVYCDDDRIYASNWLEGLVSELRQRPGHAVTASGAQLDQTYQIKRNKPPVQPRAIRKRVKYDFRYLSGRLIQFVRSMCGLPAPKPHRCLYEKGGYVDFAMGVGGVAIRPGDLPDVAFNIPDIAWPVDDIWLSGCLELNGVSIWASDRVPMATAAEASDVDGLAGTTFDGIGRHENDRACIAHLCEYYGIWS